MRITDLLKPAGIALNASAASKAEAIDRLIELMDAAGNLNDTAAYKAAVLEREKSGTTGIGEGIAIPHAKTAAVKRAGLAAMVVKDGVDFESLDGQPANLFFMIAAPDSAANLHVEVLSRLATILMDAEFRQSLIEAKDVDSFLQLIDQTESSRYEESVETPAPAEKKFEVLAVTACPTGIAHTYMAAESLETKAKEMGISIKVETNGSGGVKNALTPEEIKAAKCIIVAADKKVDIARFDGKPVIQTKVADGIHKAKMLLDTARSGNVPIFHAGSSSNTVNEPTETEGLGRQIYKHLMNGVSHMLPFVIGGGILIALAFLFDDASINPANFGSNTPFAAFLKATGGAAFGFMLPILAGYIAMSIADRPGLAAGFVGGYLANAGGSGFLGALLAGFIAGYLILGIKKAANLLPQSLEGIKPVLIYPFFGVLFIGVIITFIINPPVAAINAWMTEGLHSMGSGSKVFLGVLLGGMMAIDMGGPINKAAYVFGTASLASEQFDIMAAVMAGGMVPPLAIALCTTIFKNRFTERERKSGFTNYIMGFSFITEGAIPFAAADPLRVIPACAVGAAVAGGMSMLFGCALRAPHGGLFVVPVITNPGGYLAALGAGAVVGMLILGLLKKPLKE